MGSFQERSNDPKIIIIIIIILTIIIIIKNK